MVKYIIITFTLIISGIVYSENKSNWTQEWWDNEFQPEILQQQQQELNKQELLKCKKKLNYYSIKIDNFPHSIYYYWELKKWKEKCK